MFSQFTDINRKEKKRVLQVGGREKLSSMYVNPIFISFSVSHFYPRNNLKFNWEYLNEPSKVIIFIVTMHIRTRLIGILIIQGNGWCTRGWIKLQEENMKIERKRKVHVTTFAYKPQVTSGIVISMLQKLHNETILETFSFSTLESQNACIFQILLSCENFLRCKSCCTCFFFFFWTFIVKRKLQNCIVQSAACFSALLIASFHFAS